MADDDQFSANALADYIRRLFRVESGGDPNAVTGSNRGLGQFGPAEERQFGITSANRTDPNAQAAAVAREYAANNARLARVLGREPTFADHYFTHQQGVAGGPALLTADPQTPAWKVIRPFYGSDRVAQKAITGNIPSDSPLRQLPVDQISAGGFRGLWQDRFNRGMTRAGLSGEAPPVPAEAGPVSPGLQNAMQPQGNVLQPQGNQAAQSAMLSPLTSASQQGLAPPAGGVQAALAGLGSPSSGGGTFAGIGKSLMAEAGKTKGLPFPDAKLKPFDENLRPLPLNLPANFAAMAQIPKFAEGGIVDRPTVAMLGERGPEAIVPLTDLERMERSPYEKLQGYLETLAAAHAHTGAAMAARSLAAPYVKGLHPFQWSPVGVPPGLDPAFVGIPTSSLEDVPPSRNIEYRGNRAPALPGFAEGGIVDRPTVAMVGENGPEAIVPLYGKLGSGETSDPFAAAAARTRAPYTRANARTSGLPEFIDYLKNRAVSAATAPLDALTGRMQVSDPTTGMPTPEAMQRGQGVAGMAMTGAIPFAERGAAGVFGGKLGSSEALPKLRAAFDSIRAAQGNVGIAPISELIAQSGFSKEVVHKALLDAAQRGEVTLHQGNQAGESQIIRDAAISFPGESPLKYAFFKDKPKGAEPKSREEIRRELREGMARSKLGSSGGSTPDPSDRINFQSAGVQRDPGKALAERQPAMETPEAMAKRKAEMKAAFDELMKKGKPEKTKAAPSASGRIGFKSLGTER